ncbi:hypothetical protein FRAHR75_770019 [Frankia sp. Hr75.2]|nr:hypothetical protein FRAHR75_770019 [Frankia sp. Hr75.2]
MDLADLYTSTADEALTAARSLDNPADRAFALSNIGGNLTEPTRTDVFTEAVEAARLVDDPKSQAQSLMAVTSSIRRAL